MKIAQILPSNPEAYTPETIRIVIANVIQLATTIAGGIAIIFLIWAGFQYFTAYGNEEKANKAKITITWAIVGLIIIILAKIIVREIWGLATRGEPSFWF